MLVTMYSHQLAAPEVTEQVLIFSPKIALFLLLTFIGGGGCVVLLRCVVYTYFMRISRCRSDNGNERISTHDEALLNDPKHCVATCANY